MTDERYGPEHPVWKLLRLAIIMVTLGIILYSTAERFDNTELQTLVTMFLALAGYEAAAGFISRRRSD